MPTQGIPYAVMVDSLEHGKRWRDFATIQEVISYIASHEPKDIIRFGVYELLGFQQSSAIAVMAGTERALRVAGPEPPRTLPPGTSTTQ